MTDLEALKIIRELADTHVEQLSEDMVSGPVEDAQELESKLHVWLEALEKVRCLVERVETQDTVFLCFEELSKKGIWLVEGLDAEHIMYLMNEDLGVTPPVTFEEVNDLCQQISESFDGLKHETAEIEVLDRLMVDHKIADSTG